MKFYKSLSKGHKITFWGTIFIPSIALVLGWISILRSSSSEPTIINNSGAFANGDGASAVQNNYGSLAKILSREAQTLNVATSTGYEQTYELHIAGDINEKEISVGVKGMVGKPKPVITYTWFTQNGISYTVRVSFVTSEPIKGEETTFKVVQ